MEKRFSMTIRRNCKRIVLLKFSPKMISTPSTPIPDLQIPIPDKLTSIPNKFIVPSNKIYTFAPG